MLLAMAVASKPGIVPLTREPGYLLTRWVIGAIVVTALYVGRAVLIPIALAILLSFLLAPAVALLRRIHVPRAPAVFLAIALALGGISVTGTILFSQASSLTEDAPLYAERITNRIVKVRAMARDSLGFLMHRPDRGSDPSRTSDRRQLDRDAEASEQASDAIPVELREPPPTPFQDLVKMISPAVGPIETTLIVLVLAIFILFQRHDLRDRLIRLFGVADLHRTSLALDDGAQRLSRYFLSQFAVNCAFGAVIWLGLFLIGIPSPGLWGILAGLLRFAPYVGALIAALGPLALAMAVDPGWSMIVAVALLFLIVEPLIGYAVEPFLYGRSTGLSPVTVVVAAVFWTWIWGALGLILSMPLTLMLVALGRHIPAFAFFDILFGDRPPLSASETFYQRILSGHVDEAMDHAEDVLAEMPLAQYFDDVVLAGLRLAAEDMDRGLVDRAALTEMAQATVKIVQSLADHVDEEVEPAATPDLAPLPSPGDGDGAGEGDAPSCARRVLCLPARGPLDPAVGAMLAVLLARRGCSVDQIERSDPALAEGLMEQGPASLCIVGLFGPRAYRRVEKMRRQLGQRFPDLHIVSAVRRQDETDRETDPAPAPSLAAAVDDLITGSRQAQASPA